jgi:hypothetical protein
MDELICAMKVYNAFTNGYVEFSSMFDIECINLMSYDEVYSFAKF